MTSESVVNLIWASRVAIIWPMYSGVPDQWGSDYSTLGGAFTLTLIIESHRPQQTHIHTHTHTKQGNATIGVDTLNARNEETQNEKDAHFSRALLWNAPASLR